jgi:hypothetical protein
MDETVVPPVGELTEPTDDERALFLAHLRYRRDEYTAAHNAARGLSRVCDQAAVYTRYDAGVPLALTREIEDREDDWERARRG